MYIHTDTYVHALFLSLSLSLRAQVPADLGWHVCLSVCLFSGWVGVQAWYAAVALDIDVGPRRS